MRAAKPTRRHTPEPAHLPIERIGSEGDGIAHLADGTPLYIPFTLPGETVSAHPTQSRGDGWHAIAGIIEGEMGIEASIGIIVDRFDYSDDDHLSVKWLGVAPNYRTSNHGAKLLSFARWFQEGVGIPLFLELLTVRELQAKMHLYSRTLPQVGAQYSFGGAPEGQFNQGRVGDDPHGKRGRLLKKAKAAHAHRTPVPSQAA